MSVNIPKDTELKRIQEYASGVQNLPTFHPNYHTRGGVSHLWKGPSVYMPHPWNRYANVDEFGQQHERLIYRNNFWWLFNPEEPIIDHCHRPLRQKWNGYPFLHSTRHNKLLNEHETTIIPRDARLFYNEEDWIKYKEIVRAPSLPGLGLREVLGRRNRPFPMTKTKRTYPELHNSPMRLYSGP